MKQLVHCGKIGFLPYRLRHIGMEDAAPIYVQTSSLSPLFYIQLVLKVKQQVDAACCWVCHGRFHDVLPKEHPRALYDVPWGL